MEPKDRKLLETVKEVQAQVYDKIAKVVQLRQNRPREIEALVARRLDLLSETPVDHSIVTYDRTHVLLARRPKWPGAAACESSAARFVSRGFIELF